MKTTVTLLLATVFCAVGMQQVAGAAPDPKSVGVTLVGVGGVRKELVEEVAGHLSKTFQVPVHVRYIDASVKTTPLVLANQVDGKREEGDLCVVGLVKAPLKWPRRQLYKWKSLALLSTDAYEPLARKDAADAKSRWRLRLKKETVRCAAALVGTPECVFPRCALLDHANDQEMDAKGYNPCPPCLVQLRKALAEAGAIVKPRKP